MSACSLTEYGERTETVRLGSINLSRALTNSGETGGDVEKRPSVKVVVANTWQTKQDTATNGERRTALSIRTSAGYGRTPGANKQRVRISRGKFGSPRATLQEIEILWATRHVRNLLI